MTKQDFLNGKSFRVAGPTYTGAPTFKYEDKCIIQESRTTEDERVLFSEYLCNIKKIGRTYFSGFTFIINKKVTVKYKFEDLVEFIERI
jgi:hypothetical protein